ncbi:DUF6578 domain-containing protein [Glutamicibacter sp.]|uniref:DUF6578 domain-containing protein n=1 Tax=Glutamicibacter sp. TaxID=1931995 RepID=UPI0028BEDE17|nr:DUF6578 domain-containing protein [Glutamicibacter sp.]
MKISVHMAISDYACCGEDLWLGKQVSWPVASVVEDQSQQFVLDSHEQCSENGADVVVVVGKVEKIRVLREQRGTKVWTEPARLIHSMDVDADELQIDLDVPDGLRRPEPFSWSEIDYDAQAEEAQRVDDAYRRAEQEFIETELHNRLMVLGRQAAELLGPRLHVRADELGGLSISGPGSHGTCWGIGVASGIDQDVDDYVILEVGVQEWQLDLSGRVIDLLAGVVNALAAQRVRSRTEKTPPDQILDHGGALWV